MKTKHMKQRLGNRTTLAVSMESAISTTDSLPFADPPAEEPESSITFDAIDPKELLTELSDELKDIDIHINSMEALLLVSDTVNFQNLYPSASLESSVIEYLGNKLKDPHAAQRMISATITGNLQCGADIVAFEDMAANAAKTHWMSVASKINNLSQKNGQLSDITANAGKRITEQFKALKTQVWGYKGGNEVKVNRLVTEGSTLAKSILNTQQALALDIGLRATTPMDRAIDGVASKSASVINSGKSDQLAAISATAVKEAQTLSNAYSAYENAPEIIGYVRTAMDDEQTLPQGIVSALTGAERKYNYPRYKRISKGSGESVVITPQLAKQLYDLGLNIGRDITEQSRAWDLRLGTLKGLSELTRRQATNVDADKNTWAAEQRAALNVLRMWATNASARRYYISVYNKLASQLLDLLNSSTTISGKAALESYSQELFGFGKPKVVKLEDGIEFIKMNVSKIKACTVSMDTALFNSVSGAGEIEQITSKILAPIHQFVNSAKSAYAAGRNRMDEYEESDDDYQMDQDLTNDFKQLAHSIGSGKDFGPVTITADLSRLRIDGTYTSVPANNVDVQIDVSAAKRLLGVIDNIHKTIKAVLDLGYLEYAQSLCDWQWEIREMLMDMIRALVAGLLKALGDKVTISQELFGWGKKKEEVKPSTSAPQHPKYRTPEELIKVLESKDYSGVDSTANLTILGYDASFAKHAQLTLDACAEYSHRFTEANLIEFVKTVNALTDSVYAKLIDSDHTEADDWKKQGNDLLAEVMSHLINDGVYRKFWDMTRVDNGVKTNFRLLPNVVINMDDYKLIDNPKVRKLPVSGVTAEGGLKFLKATHQIVSWDMNAVSTDNKFLKTFPKFEDAFIQTVYHPVLDINSAMCNIVDFTHDLISKSIKFNDAE